MDNSSQCVVLVLVEMGLSFLGIVSNLLVVTTLRQEESLKGSTLNYLLLNLCFSNLLIAFLVKPISAIYIGYAISTGEYQVSWCHCCRNSASCCQHIYHQVGLAFCTLYTFTYRTTWCVFPFTLVAMSWCKLLAQFKCTLCLFLCCRNQDAVAGAGNGEAEMAMITGQNGEVDGLDVQQQNKVAS